MSEISMSCLTIGEITQLCATQQDCSSCIYNCGMDKLTLDTVSKRTIDSDKLIIHLKIKDILNKVNIEDVCKIAGDDCRDCPLCVSVSIGGQKFGVCLYSFNNALSFNDAEVFTTGELLLTAEQIKRFNLEEAVVNEEDREQSN